MVLKKSNRDVVRVALVAPTMQILGGHAVQARRLLESWSDDPRVAIGLVPIDPLRRERFPGLSRLKYVRTVATQLCYWPLLLRRLWRADVVHVFSASQSSFFLAPLPAILIGRLLNKPVVVNYRSGDAADHLAGSRVARAALKSVSINVVPSSFLLGVFSTFGIRANVIANLADLRRFQYRVRAPVRPRLLSTRNFDAAYNVACTLRAFGRVQARYPEAAITLVGDGPERRSLRALCRDLCLRNVTFTGPVPQADIHRQYAAADLYVQTPAFDNMPGSVIEAFASGLPVVSTDVGGVPTILKHGVHGLLGPHDDDAAIAAHLVRLLEAPDYARQLAAAAFATCAAYEWPVIRDQWLEVYCALAGAAQGRDACADASVAHAQPRASG
jgi:glycosyltransferase involved in cell wall biosynthesis